MTELDEVTWPTEALEQAVIGDGLYESAVDADDDLLAATEYGCLYWEGSSRSPVRLCGTDIPGGITLDAAHPYEHGPHSFSEWDDQVYAPAGVCRDGTLLTPLFGDLTTPADQLPELEDA